MAALPFGAPIPRPGDAGHAPYDPFQGYFARDGNPVTESGSLLDLPAARRWFDHLRWGCEEDLYTYQQPLQGRSGPRVLVGGRPILMLGSYDYLGLLGCAAVEEAAVAAVLTYGTGTGGVRMLTGTTTLHHELERELAAFKGVEAALTFGSGYLANLAAIGALVGPRDRVVMDARAHRSLHDACVLARVPVRTFRHNDPASLRRELERPAFGRRTLIVVDGLYSMDGDICPLPEMVAVKREFGAFLLVDEAHSLGVLGESGRGVHEHFSLAADAVDIWTGSLSKAIPSNGGFVAGSRELGIYLQHVTAPFWFSAALCPAAVGAALAALRVIRREPARLGRLRHNAAWLRDGLCSRGYRTGASAGPIIPVIVGTNETAWRLARRLFDQGVMAPAIVYPAVPLDMPRLRLCATAAQSEADLDEALAAFQSARS
jgi:glycine C-acetyltransferase